MLAYRYAAPVHDLEHIKQVSSTLTTVAVARNVSSKTLGQPMCRLSCVNPCLRLLDGKPGEIVIINYLRVETILNPDQRLILILDKEHPEDKNCPCLGCTWYNDSLDDPPDTLDSIDAQIQIYKDPENISKYLWAYQPPLGKWKDLHPQYPDI